MLSNDVAISVRNLSKSYTIRHNAVRHTTIREALLQGFKKPLPNVEKETFWALKDLNFDVHKGDVVGIIGRNGAGKSTLLKVLSQITEPTTGEINLYGRVGSLLEVGTGFHPELTGRENIYLNGAILGMRRTEINKEFDAIVDFAEVERFLDTPVKRYSSGMYVRLAFAVAAHLNPEILIVDEVLAVGDSQFQKKCLGKMEDVSRHGKTVVFVSHSMGVIQRLCRTGIVMKKGQIAFQGTAADCVDAYLRDAVDGGQRKIVFEKKNNPIHISSVAVIAKNKNMDDVLDIKDELELHIDYTVQEDIRGTNMSIAINREGAVLMRSWDIDHDKDSFSIRKDGDYKAKIKLPVNLFAPGRYTINVAAGRPGAALIEAHADCVAFELENLSADSTHMSFSRGGAIISDLVWDIERHAVGSFHEATA